jgi:hypothetical protein
MVPGAPWHAYAWLNHHEFPLIFNAFDALECAASGNECMKLQRRRAARRVQDSIPKIEPVGEWCLPYAGWRTAQRATGAELRRK